VTGPALVAGLVAAAAVLAWPRSARSVAVERLAQMSAEASGAGAVRAPPPRGRRRLVVPFAAVGLLALLSGAATDPVVLMAAGASVAALVWFDRRRPAVRARRLRAEEAAALPLAADLLAACLSSGATAADALAAVGAAMEGPLAGRLCRVGGALSLGASAEEAWDAGPDDPVAPLARAFARALATGAPLADTVLVVALDQRRARRWAAEAAARRAGVLAVGPLAACFLPAFVLLGVVPVVLAVAGRVLSDLG